MFSRVYSSHIIGVEGVLVEVEVDISSMGLPSFSVVGLAEGAVRESRDRVKSSLKNHGFNIFAKPITVNLAPADFKKEGTHFDLPIAISLLSATPDIDINTENTLFMGELSLDGKLRGVSGVLPTALAAKKHGITKLIIPKENIKEAGIVPDVDVYGFENLSEVIDFLCGTSDIKPHKEDITELFKYSENYNVDFEEVKGQFAAKRAAEIAASGKHNILFLGVPGSGKTMISKRIPTILPEMTLEEALVTTKVHSVAGLMTQSGNLITQRPFIAPHHTASDVAIIGGGSKAKPGNVSIAHNGILFLDEMLEFNRSVLEVLRQPLEEGNVTIARAGRTVTYPADFMLVAAANPCPCGFYGDSKKECSCSVTQIQKYRSRLSGPLLDRIDLHIQVSAVELKDINDPKTSESSSSIRKRVTFAHQMQKERFKNTEFHFNSQIHDKHINDLCPISSKTKDILQNAMKKFNLSARAYNKLIKTARTIADLEQSKDIDTKHVLEALQYRMLDQN